MHAGTRAGSVCQTAGKLGEEGQEEDGMVALVGRGHVGQLGGLFSRFSAASDRMWQRSVFLSGLTSSTLSITPRCPRPETEPPPTPRHPPFTVKVMSSPPT